METDCFSDQALYPVHPEIVRQRYVLLGVENYALGFEQMALDVGIQRIRADTDLTFGIDDPVPGDIGAVRQGVQSITHLTGATGQSGKRGNLFVGGNFAKRYTLDNCIYIMVQF